MKAHGSLAVDTNAVIAYREGIPEVCRIIDATDVIFLPAPVFGELLYGALNSSKIQKNELAVQKFADHSVLLPVNREVAARYARIRFDLKTRGTPIPENDIWIAAVCMENEIPLMSRDEHFNFIENLVVYRWD